ncbi:MAG TPA: ribonuclease III [Deltaproteobacteria bacterium]|nr:ribonuclease III [Deltaproteobacteria bacterium]
MSWIWRVCSVVNESLESRIAYTFTDKALLKEALTHTTYVNEHRDESLRDNQRLEFLGDSIITSIVTAWLFGAFPDEKEGVLTKKRAELINEGTLSRIARHMCLGQELFLGRGEENDGGSTKDSILADAYEALIGGMFLDSSFETVSRVVKRHFEVVLGSLDEISITDYKSALLEYCQARFKELPRIVVTNESGPEHDKEFEVHVTLQDRIIGQGRGRNKKQAAQTACKEALLLLEHPR